MRKMLTLSFAALLIFCDPVTIHAEGTLHPRDSAGPRKIHVSDCRPGRDPVDLDCCGDKLANCRLQCKDDYAENGDMLYLRYCERECEEELRACKEGR